jgi:hypothetical protein
VRAHLGHLTRARANRNGILKLLPLPNTGPPGSLVNNFNWTDYTSDLNRC